MQRSQNRNPPACSPPLLNNPEEFPQLAKSKETKNVMETYKRFLTVRHKDPNNKLSFDNPWEIQRKLLAVIGKKQASNISSDWGRLRSGVLLIEVHQKQLRDKMLQIKKLGDIEVVIEEHQFLNTSKGTVYCDAIKNMSVDDIKKEMKSQDVIDVYRFTKKEGDVITPMHLYVLTFNKPTLPSEVKIGYIKCDVRMFIPNPRRCFQCQQYGHGKNTCTHETVCVTCGQAGHEYGDAECSKEPKCFHCEKEHAANSKKCAMYLLEKMILTEKHTKNLSVKAATSIVYASNPKKVSEIPKLKKSAEKKTYSNVTANPSINEDLRLQNEELKLQNEQLKHKMDLLTNQLSSLLTALSQKQSSLFIPVPNGFSSDNIHVENITDSQDLPDIRPTTTKRSRQNASTSSQDDDLAEPSSKMRASSDGQEEKNMPAPDPR